MKLKQAIKQTDKMVKQAINTGEKAKTKEAEIAVLIELLRQEDRQKLSAYFQEVCRYV